jgi:hypothetical protein
MAIAERTGHTTKTATGASAAPQITLSQAPVQNNLLVAFVTIDTTTPTLSAAAGWTKLTTQANTVNCALFWKVAGVGESATQQPASLSASDDWIVIMTEFSGAATSLPVDVEGAGLDSTSPFVTPGVDPVDGVERLAVLGVGSNDNDTPPYDTEQVGGNVATEIGEVAFAGPKLGAGAWFYVYASTPAGTISGQASGAPNAASTAHIAFFKPGAAALTQSVSGTLSSSAGVQKEGRKFPAGTVTSSALLVKRTERALTAAIASAGALLKETRRALGGAFASSGALGLVRIFAHAVGGAIAPVGGLVKLVAKPLAGALASAGSVLKEARKFLAGAIAWAGSLLAEWRGALCIEGTAAPDLALMGRAAGDLGLSGLPVSELVGSYAAAGDLGLGGLAAADLRGELVGVRC